MLISILLLLLLAFAEFDEFTFQGLAHLHLCEGLLDGAHVDILNIVDHSLGESIRSYRPSL